MSNTCSFAVMNLYQLHDTSILSWFKINDPFKVHLQHFQQITSRTVELCEVFTLFHIDGVETISYWWVMWRFEHINLLTLVARLWGVQKNEIFRCPSVVNSRDLALFRLMYPVLRGPRKLGGNLNSDQSVVDFLASSEVEKLSCDPGDKYALEMILIPLRKKSLLNSVNLETLKTCSAFLFLHGIWMYSAKWHKSGKKSRKIARKLAG